MPFPLLFHKFVNYPCHWSIIFSFEKLCTFFVLKDWLSKVWMGLKIIIVFSTLSTECWLWKWNSMMDFPGPHFLGYLSSSKSNCQTSVASTIIGCFKKCKEIVHNFDLIQVQFWVQSYFQFCKSSHVLQNHMFFSKLVESLTLHQGIFISLAQPFKYQTNIYPYIL